MIAKIKIRLVLILFGLGQIVANAQIGIMNNNPDKSAAMDIKASNKALLIPRVNLKSLSDIVTIPNPTTSLLVYNTNDAIGNGSGFYYYNNGWNKLIPIDNTGDNLGDHIAVKDLNIKGNKLYFKNADGIKVMLTNSEDGPLISLVKSDWTTNFITGRKGVANGEYIWSTYGGAGNSSTIEKMRLNGQGYLGIGTSLPKAQLEVAGSAQIDSTLTVKNLPPSADSDYLLAVNTNGGITKSNIQIGNIPRRYNYTISSVSPGRSSNVEIVAESAYKLIVYTGDSCGNKAVATFIVKDNSSITMLGGQAYRGEYQVTPLGNNGNSLQLIADSQATCSTNGLDVHQFDFTITITSNVITIINNNTSVPQSYNLKIAVI